MRLHGALVHCTLLEMLDLLATWVTVERSVNLPTATE